ncbi:MAG TPA: double zinc ribbon domain-containing protein [Opitutaceae bacterium]|nr:double zinc ribbon domain-containing protein [Opitutaceae bacterium]
MPLALVQLGRGFVDSVFPPVCVHCRGLVEPEGRFRHLCMRCAAQLNMVEPPFCEVCGHPFYGVVLGERTCPHCQGLQPEFGAGRTAVLFKGPARALVIELKYHRGLYVLRDLETIFRDSPHVLNHVRGGILVPVPLHPRKQRERGFNQTALLAEALAQAAAGGTTVAHLLRRVADTQSQTAFDRRTRLANLKNAFALAAGASITPAQHYILIDDVFTTGSTLNSCAHALRREGCLNLDVVTFGHG